MEIVRLPPVNWRALRVQKMILLNMIDRGLPAGNGESALDGIVELLDGIQDNAVIEQAVPKTDVFTSEELHAAGIENIEDAPFVLFDVWTNEWLDAFADIDTAKKQVENLCNFEIATQVCTKETWEEIQKEKKDGN